VRLARCIGERERERERKEREREREKRRERDREIYATTHHLSMGLGGDQDVHPARQDM
jgi:hypothetical protein